MELAVKENKTATAAKKQGHFFGKKSGVPFFFPVFIQPKLTIGAVDDPYEREADAMAAKVMRIENKNSAQTFFKPAVASIQRKCAHCEEEERVQKKDAGGGATSSTAPALVREVVSSPGQPLEKNTAGFMESRFGYEFGNVRIHNDVQAHQSAASINALAYTHKNHVVFAKDQFQPFTNNGRQLLAHELTHTLQQQYTTPLIQRRKADEQSVKQCREDQKSGHILPQHIEEAERKKQDVLLDIVLKKDRKAFEKMIRDDIDALMFVCEEGVPAVLALYYNRDHNNSLFITKARKSYASFPDYYSSLGVAKSHRQKQILETTFGISIIRGNKDWSPRDLSLLQQALAKLTVNESSFIRGYQFIRWTTTCAHLKSDNPDHECELEDYQRCGFHIAEIADRSRNIWIYDCMDASPHSEYSVDPGADTILHEIGHAIERGQNMTTMERSADADKAYEIKKALLGKAAPTDKAALTAEVEKLKIAKDKANAEMYKVTSNNTLVRFSKLINRKKQLTEYSKVNDIEAFGDAFMLFKVNPKALEAGNKAMYDFFVNEKFGDFKTGAAGREMKLKESCTGDSARIGEWVTVKNQHDFAALDGYSPIKGKMHDVFYDGKNHFFCFNDKRVYFKYSENKSGVTPDLETAYNIKVINGGAEWLQPELAIVSEALSMLSPGEVADLRGYRFIKEGGVRIDDGDKVTAGLTTPDIVHNKYMIQFWKFCFDGSGDTDVKHMGGISPGVSCVLHEIGHIMMFARQKPWMEAMYLRDKYQEVYDKASPAKQYRMESRLQELKDVHDRQEAINKAKGPVDAEFLKLLKGTKDKKPFTTYSMRNEREAFAEAFAIYKVNPELLKKKNLKLYQYFVDEGYQ